MLRDSFNLLKSYLVINRKAFFTPLLVIILFKIALSLFYIKSGYVVLMISFAIVTSLTVAIMTKIISTGDNAQGFSYKYFWNLPMNKKSLLIGFSLIGVARVIPIILSIWVFYDYFLNILHLKENDFGALSLISIDLIFISIIFSLISYHSSFTHRRQQNKKEKLGTYGLFIYSSLFFTSIYILRYIDQLSIYFFETFFGLKNFDLGELFYKIISSPYNLLFFSAIIYFIFNLNLKHQRNEIHNYIIPLKQNRKLLFSAIASVPINIYILFFTDFGLGPEKQFFGHPLLLAIESKDLAKIKTELSKIQDINFENKYGITPMYAAISTGNLEIIRLIEEKGGHYKANYKAKDYLDKNEMNISAYDIAVGTNNFETIKHIADKNGISLNEFSMFQGGSPLHLAAKKCNLTLARKLIAQNVDINSPTHLTNNTPLMLATESRCAAIVLLLLNHGADRNLLNHDGKKAVDFTKKGTKSDLEIEGILSEN